MNNPELRVAIKISRGIHKIANGDIHMVDGTVYPCHHSGFDTEAKMYAFGHSKKEVLHTNVVVPAYDTKGTPYNLFGKIKKGDVVTIRSRYRVALSHSLRVATLAQDEASVTFSATLPT